MKLHNNACCAIGAHVRFLRWCSWPALTTLDRTRGGARVMAGKPEAVDDLKAMLESRTQLYECAHSMIGTARVSRAEAVAQILAEVSGSEV